MGNGEGEIDLPLILEQRSNQGRISLFPTSVAVGIVTQRPNPDQDVCFCPYGSFCLECPPTP